MDWTFERVELLKQRHAAGLSMRQIAAELGGVTKNSVVGKSRRLGLVSKRAPGHQTGEPYVRRERQITVRSNYATRRENDAQRPAREKECAVIRGKFDAIEIAGELPAAAVPLLGLNGHTCRWPLGDPRDLDAMRYCGAEPKADRPYCADHCRLAFVPMQRRARAHV